MLNVDTPNTSDLNSPEDNIRIIKGWAEALVSELQYKVYDLEDRISILEGEINKEES